AARMSGGSRPPPSSCVPPRDVGALILARGGRWHHSGTAVGSARRDAALRRGGLTANSEEDRRATRILSILCVASIAYGLQQSMVFPAMPTVQRDFDTSTAWIAWLANSFLIASIVATPIIGKLGDQFGKARMLKIALAMSIIGSLGACAAPNLWLLFVA